MRQYFLLFTSCCFVVALAGCSKPEPQVSNGSSPNPTLGASEVPIDACSLLTPEEIQAVMGEAVGEKRPDRQVAEGFTISQCYFALITPSNFVNLRLVQPSEDATARNPRQVWQETFAKGLGEAESRKGPPQPVAGVGEETFWIGGSETGGLYVLKGNRYFRLGLGGEPNQANKIEKAKTLAGSILKRL